jgi:hypothetical protein
MAIEDRAHIAQRQAGNGRDFRLGTSSQREPSHCRPAQVMKGHADDTCCLAGFAPRCPEAIRCPRFAFGVGEDDRAALRCGIERGFEWRANRDFNAPSGLRLPQPNPFPVIGRPWKPQEITLPLSGPERERKRQMKMRGRAFEKRGPSASVQIFSARPPPRYSRPPRSHGLAAIRPRFRLHDSTRARTVHA